MRNMTLFLSPECSYIAAVSVELDYKKIDINQCDGELQFNTFAASHKCKRETTVVRYRIIIRTPLLDHKT